MIWAHLAVILHAQCFDHLPFSAVSVLQAHFVLLNHWKYKSFFSAMTLLLKFAKLRLIFGDGTHSVISRCDRSQGQVTATICLV